MSDVTLIIAATPTEGFCRRFAAAVRLLRGKTLNFGGISSLAGAGDAALHIFSAIRNRDEASYMEKLIVRHAVSDPEDPCFYDLLTVLSNMAADRIMAYFDEYPDGTLVGYDADEIDTPEEVAQRIWYDAMAYAVDVILFDKLRRIDDPEEDIHCLATMYDTIIADMKERGELKPCDPDEDCDETETIEE